MKAVQNIFMKTLRLCCIWLVFSQPIMNFSPARAMFQSQTDDPAAQCAEGTKLFLDDKPEQALPFLERGFEGRTIGQFANPEDWGKCASALGGIYLATGEYTKALDVYSVALVLFRESGDREFEGVTLNNIGVVYKSQGEYFQALNYYQQALVIRKEVGDRTGESKTLNNIGMVYAAQGRSTLALEYYQQALVIRREVADRIGEGRILSNIGVVSASQGQSTQALEYFQPALALAREFGDRIGEGVALNNIGEVYSSRGQSAQALEYYQQSLVIRKEVGDRAGEMATLNNLGVVFQLQGQYPLAAVYIQQALEVARKLGDRAGEGTTLNNLAGIYLSQGQTTHALEYFQQALVIQKEVGNRSGEGTALSNIGMAHQSQGQYAQALEYYQQALAIQKEVGNRSGEGTALNNIGEVHRLQKQNSKALEYFQQALVVLKQIDDRTGEGKTLNNIGLVYKSQGQSEQALDYYRQAIDIFERLRAQVNQEQSRADFISQYTFIYDNTLELLVKENELNDAFRLTEQGRARAFLDSLSTNYVELSDAGSAILYEKEQETYATRQFAQKSLAKAREQNPQDEQLIADLTAQLAQAEKDYQAALDSLSERKNYLEQLIPGRSKVLDVSQAQALLDAQTTLLSFWVLDDQTLVFVLTQNTFNTVALSVSRMELYAKIKAFREFSNTDAIYPESAIELYQILIEPLKKYLSTSNLVIVPQGELHYLPFAALTDGQSYLVDDYTITYLPSVSAWPYIQQNAGKTNANPLIIGNPASDNTELKPLLFAETEAQTIAGLYQVTPLLGKTATESAVRSQVGQAGVLHLAAHGSYNPLNPMYSAIYLAPDGQNDGLLEVHEIYGLDLKQTDLVVLSACETQLGELSSGDELVGLTRAFFFAGAPSVISSLWPVDDKATQVLMEKFYANWRGGKGKAEALRQAQIDVRAKYPNPYYWAGFVLSGNGKESTWLELFRNLKPTDILIVGSLCCCCLLVGLIVVVTVGVFLRRKKRLIKITN